MVFYFNKKILCYLFVKQIYKYRVFTNKYRSLKTIEMALVDLIFSVYKENKAMNINLVDAAIFYRFLPGY